MDAATRDCTAYIVDPQEPQGGSDLFSAPLAGLKTGRLVLASAIEWIKLSADPRLPCLYQARIQGATPGVRIHENTITLDPGLQPLHQDTAQTKSPLVEIWLNSTIPWEIECRQGVSHLDADLRQLELRSLDVLGSASHTRLALPPPSGVLYFYISGEASQCEFLTYPGLDVKVHLSDGANDLSFDHQCYEVLKGEANLASPGFGGARDRYEICIGGAVNRLAIQSRGD